MGLSGLFALMVIVYALYTYAVRARKAAQKKKASQAKVLLDPPLAVKTVPADTKVSPAELEQIIVKAI